MIRLLERAAAASPDHPAVTTHEGSATYAEVLRDARGIAAALQQRGIERFALVEPDMGWVLRVLAGAALAGVEPCQYQADMDAAEFADQSGALGHTVVVSRRTDLGAALEVIDPLDLALPPPDDFVPADGSQPLIIRTTGTTGLPKAARHDWQVLSRTVADRRPRSDQRWLMAYGPHQFAGIQMMLHVVASQATLVAPFPRQPRDGLDALISEGVTCLSATPTYWRFLLAEARSRKVELPPLQQVTLGGEASPQDLLDELKSTFPGAKVSHVYASTEFGSVAAVSDGRPGFAVSAVFGNGNTTSSLRIIDGELWVRATAGMLEYAGEPAPDVDHPDDEWKPTGDLVEIVGDRVEFRGRTSEVINVGGVKVHPLPIEKRISALDSVALVRVFGRANRLTGAIVAAEIVPNGSTEDIDTEHIRRQVKAAVSDLPPAWHPRSITFVEAIETRGDKTIRRMEP